MGYLIKPENDPIVGLDGYMSDRIVLLDEEGKQLEIRVKEDLSVG